MRIRASDRRAICPAGFTLIELMIVVVVLAILIAIAVPIYTKQVQQSRRTEARTAVLDLASREEKYFSTANSYATEPYQLGYVAATNTGAVWPQSTGSYYQITVQSPNPNWAGNGPSYLITASPPTTSPQYKDTSCFNFMVDQTGNQTATTQSGAANNSCWQQ
jgi:type IV pilus assembly protein PilE